MAEKNDPQAEQETLKRLSGNEKKVLLALKDHPGATADELVEPTGFEKAQEVVNAANWLVTKGLVAVDEETRLHARLAEEGKSHAQNGLPERRVVDALAKIDGGRASLQQLVADGAIAKTESGIVIGWLKRKGWAQLEKGEEGPEVVLTQKGRKSEPGQDEKLLETLASGEHPVDSLDEKAYKELKSRKGILVEREASTRRYTLNDAGRRLAESGIQVDDEVGQLTPEMLATGAWRDQALRPYDVDMHVPTPSGGKPHPLNLLIDEIREVFVAMGFQEIATDYIENAFWNMDVLFIPQGHPAREMQDTFYLDHPGRRPAPENLAAVIQDVHETGGGLGSTGWGGQWSREESERTLLRTHTTVGTIRYLHDHPEEPCKVFSIGRVFRKETMDATHLPEFHQIEGIIKEPTANFRSLVGILRTFYKRMGFEDVRLRPAYFPYTEPSMEVEVKHAGSWMELGGAGIFRPEVTQPIGVKEPVCAWGLGLERLAMMRFNLADIRDIYLSDVDWLRSAPLRQR